MGHYFSEDTQDKIEYQITGNVIAGQFKHTAQSR